MSTINTIQIKRSATTIIPTGLEAGELAYSFAPNGNTLWIGDLNLPGSSIPIGGGNYYYIMNVTPGILTPLSVMVPNTSGYMNQIKVDQLVIDNVAINNVNTFSNSIVLGLSSNTELVSSWAIKNYIDLQVLQSGIVSFTTDDSNTVTSLFVDLSGDNGILTKSFGNEISIELSNTGVVPGVYTAPTFTVDAQGRITDIDPSGFSSILTFAGDLGIDTISLFGDVFQITGGAGVLTRADNNNLSISVNHNTIDNYNANQHIDHSTLYINAGDGLVGGGVLTGNTTLSVNVPANSGLVANSSFGLSVKTGLGVYLDASGNVAIGQEVFQTSNVIFHDGTFTGDLFVQGDVTYIHTNVLEVIDPLIRLASNNSVSDIVDIGFYGESNSGSGIKFTGLFRDATDGLYKLFKDGSAQPTSTVAAPFDVATLVANITQGVVYDLLQPISVPDGGTGLSNVPINNIMVGNGTGPLNTVSGNPWEVFQIDATGAPVFGSINCGTYP